MELNASKRLTADKWSGDVKTKKHPPEGLFATGSADEIANWLHSSHKDLQSAMGSLNFYRNRAGHNLASGRASVLDSAEKKLRSKYGEKE